MKTSEQRMDAEIRLTTFAGVTRMPEANTRQPAAAPTNHQFAAFHSGLYSDSDKKAPG